MTSPAAGSLSALGRDGRNEGTIFSEENVRQVQDNSP